MHAVEKKKNVGMEWMSPFRIILLVIHTLCFGACVVLLASGASGGPLVLLTIGTGLSLGAGLIGAILASRTCHSASGHELP